MYPRIGEQYSMSQPRGICVICSQPKADYKVIVEVDIFRGNDLVYKVHKACIWRVQEKVLVKELMGD